MRASREDRVGPCVCACACVCVCVYVCVCVCGGAVLVVLAGTAGRLSGYRLTSPSWSSASAAAGLTALMARSHGEQTLTCE